MLCQTVEETGGMEHSQEFPVKPLCKWKHYIRNLRRTHTLHLSLSLSLSLFFCHNQSLFPFLTITRMSLDAVPSLLSGTDRGKKTDKLMKGTVLPLAMWCIQHRFSGLDPDGTCGSVGSQHCFVSSSWGWRFPCQCRVSTAKVHPLFPVDSRPGGLKWWQTKSVIKANLTW